MDVSGQNLINCLPFLNFHALYCTTLVPMTTFIEIVFISTFVISLSIYLVRLLLNIITAALRFNIETPSKIVRLLHSESVVFKQ